MIDWHSHILPGMDDGCRTVEESILLLKMLKEQGVEKVVLTPHFYANDESVEDFLKRRESCFAELKAHLFEGAPELLLGAEIKYYPSISRLDDIKRLTIEDKALLLLEMPFSTWTEYTVRELTELSSNTGLTVILAHIERYLKLQKKYVWERIYENELLMQVNASFFNDITTRRRAINMLKDNKIHFIGSDCHNSTTRPPNIGKAYNIIEKKLGADFNLQMCDYGLSFLE